MHIKQVPEMELNCLSSKFLYELKVALGATISYFFLHVIRMVIISLVMAGNFSCGE